MYHDKYLWSKVKSYEGKINTNFDDDDDDDDDDGMPKEGSNCICSSVISIDSIFEIEFYAMLICEIGITFPNCHSCFFI